MLRRDASNEHCLLKFWEGIRVQQLCKLFVNRLVFDGKIFVCDWVVNILFVWD